MGGADDSCLFLFFSRFCRHRTLPHHQFRPLPTLPNDSHPAALGLVLIELGRKRWNRVNVRLSLPAEGKCFLARHPQSPNEEERDGCGRARHPLPAVDEDGPMMQTQRYEANDGVRMG